MRAATLILAGAIGFIMADVSASAISPRPELRDFDAIHPVCVARGFAGAQAVATHFCAEVARLVERRAPGKVEVLQLGDMRLGQPRRIVLGFTLAVADGRLGISALLSRVDRPSAALFPPAAEILVLERSGLPDDAALAAAAVRLVEHLGL